MHFVKALVSKEKSYHIALDIAKSPIKLYSHDHYRFCRYLEKISN